MGMNRLFSPWFFTRKFRLSRKTVEKRIGKCYILIIREWFMYLKIARFKKGENL